jgi:hypothetical protein
MTRLSLNRLLPTAAPAERASAAGRQVVGCQVFSKACVYRLEARMAYRHPHIPLSRERKMRAFWTRSFKPAGQTDRLLAEIHPNSERSGCPGLWFVFAAAIRRFPADHPVFSHLTECSPCYREYRGIQQTESFVWTWQFRLSRAARGISIFLLRRLRRAPRATHRQYRT